MTERPEEDVFSFPERDDAAPHWPLTIPQSDLYERLNPLTDLDDLGEDRIAGDFREIFAHVMNTIEEQAQNDR